MPEMRMICPDCKHPCQGELSDDALLPPAICCEHCGCELELISVPNALDSDAFIDDLMDNTPGDDLQKSQSHEQRS